MTHCIFALGHDPMTSVYFENSASRCYLKHYNSNAQCRAFIYCVSLYTLYMTNTSCRSLLFILSSRLRVDISGNAPAFLTNYRSLGLCSWKLNLIKLTEVQCPVFHFSPYFVFRRRQAISVRPDCFLRYWSSPHQAGCCSYG